MDEKIKPILKEIVEDLKKEYKPIKVILFGSYAYGVPTEDSDVDIFILKDTRERSVDRIVTVKKIIYNPNRKIPVSPSIYEPNQKVIFSGTPPKIKKSANFYK